LREARNTGSQVRAEKAVLVGVHLHGEDSAGTRYDPLAELASLATSAGARIVGRLIQRRSKICASTYIGRGKASQLADYAEDRGADLAIFDNNLSPSQIRELEKVLERRVIDRTELILDIFASRAGSHAARLQVELAQLEYTAPRLRGMWSHLERIAGAGGATAAGVVGGIGTRGPGERQIEIDRRIVQKRVAALKREISVIDRRKLREVKSRREFFTVALVGYTNAGKSTLMNALTGAGTYVADKLFATLDTKTRRWELGGGQTALLSDTVGFVRNLPHNLVAAFRATLEEVIHSDLLMHVVDGASADAADQIKAVEQVLDELGCADVPVIVVLNKMDAVNDDSAAHLLRVSLSNLVEVSALEGAGLPQVAEGVLRHMRGRTVRLTMETDTGNGKLLAYVREHGHVFGQEFLDGRVRLELHLPAAEVPRAVALGGVVVATQDDPVDGPR
jgi:GTP-binding protein HflX